MKDFHYDCHLVKFDTFSFQGSSLNNFLHIFKHVTNSVLLQSFNFEHSDMLVIACL